MSRRWLAALLLILIHIIPVPAQDARSDLLSRINGLRRTLGLHAYVLNGSLNTAADNHARWMARTGQVSHTQEDGGGPRTRALNAGYGSNWVSENIYLGGSAADAFGWWLNSPVHYAGMTSPHYYDIGIGSASGSRRTAYVLVYGNNGGRASSNAAPAASPGGAPSFVLGLDEVGNIKHEVQPGDTIGDIAVIYGYGWAQVPTLQALNGMDESEYLLEIGSVFLIPPGDGTFTPVPLTPETMETAAAPEANPTETATPSPTLAPTESPTPAPALRIDVMPEAEGDGVNDAGSGRLLLPLVLAAAIVAQVGIIGGALAALLRRGG